MQRATWALMRQAEPGDDARPATRDSVRKIRKAVTLYTTGIWPSIAYGLEQYGLSPTELKQFRDTAAVCSGVGGDQSCLVTAIEIGVGQQHNPSIHSSTSLHFLLVAPLLG